MIPAKFDYVRAESVENALALLAEHGDDAKIIAGGHSLLPVMKLRLAEPSVLIDVARIRGLDSIALENGRMHVGALVRHAAIAASAEVRAHAPALHDAANQLGDPQVRNRGTFGGAAAHADPSADYPAVLLALGATLRIAGSDGERDVAADEFFRGMFETDLRPGELLLGASFPVAPCSAYAKYHHPASHYAVVGVAVNLSVEGDTIGEALVAVTGVGDSHFRARSVETALRGSKHRDNAALMAACAGVAAGVDARSDRFASGDYRRAMGDVFARRAVEQALKRIH